MKKIIRKNVFETNSSSSHSISIEQRREIELPKLPRNSTEVYLLEEIECANSYEKGYTSNKLMSEVGKARFMLNVIASYLDEREDYDDEDYKELAYWIDYENNIINQSRTFEVLLKQKPFVWFKEVLEEETKTKFEFVEPNDKEFPFYERVWNEGDSIQEIFECDWKDEKSFKEYIKNIIFNDEIYIEDEDYGYGCYPEYEII